MMVRAKWFTSFPAGLCYVSALRAALAPSSVGVCNRAELSFFQVSRKTSVDI